jgi:pyruvate/2-oxoglutarate dehydrogenase complex dihydrolipoamide dehydrogenase (E3) component
MSESFDYDLVCIGSGPAGQRAAVQAAKLGKRVAVVERQRSLGGVSIERGTIPSLPFSELVSSPRPGNNAVMAKGQEKPKKVNKPKLSTKEKQAKKKEKKMGAAAK